MYVKEATCRWDEREGFDERKCEAGLDESEAPHPGFHEKNTREEASPKG